MTAAHLWIFLPLLAGGVAFLLPSSRALARWGALVALALTLLAWFVPLDTPFQLAGLSLKISSTFQFLGRSLTFRESLRPVLLLFYGLTAMWFYGVRAVEEAWRIVPWGLVLSALLVTLLTVNPFLYTALVLEAIGLLLLFLLTESPQAALRLLAHQTLAFPLLLLSTSFLGSGEAVLADPERGPLVIAMLGLGLALAIGLFPFHTWLPLIGEEAHPYLAGFLFWIIPTGTVLFGVGFLERFSSLQYAPALPGLLQTAGLVMAIAGGGWAAMERHWGRALGYVMMAEIGYTLLALSLENGYSLALFSLLPRGLALTVWGLALSVLQRQAGELSEKGLHGLGHRLPFAAAALTLAVFSVAGFPLLASFPWRLALWEGLGLRSPALAFGFLLSLLGLYGHGLRTFATLFAHQQSDWQSAETLLELTLLILGVLGMVAVGLFPQSILFLLER